MSEWSGGPASPPGVAERANHSAPRTLTLTAVPTWSVEVLHGDDALGAVREEWDDLVARCASATPFQSHAWLDSWWRHYGRRGRLHVVLVRRDGRLVAAAALQRRRRGPCTVLSPLGGALSDFTDVLVDDAVAVEAARGLVAVLVGQRGWHALDFPETRPGSVVGEALRAGWPGRSYAMPASLCLELPSTTTEQLLRDLPSHARKTVRRRVNQIERLGITTRAVPVDEVDRAVAGLLALHTVQWQGRGVNRAHLSPEFAGHLGRAVRAMVGTGQAALLEYRLGDRLIASNLVLVGPALAGGYLYGAEPELRDEIDISTLLVTSTMTEAYGRQCATMSMLRGAEPYKLRWRPTEVTNERVLLARPGSVSALGYTAVVRATAAAKGWAKHRAPWLRDVRDTGRRLAARLRPGAR
jgi:CelD/BcsL family acetyltransferase involved in cellulose biosynthesis